MPVRVAAIVVNYNAGRLLASCVATLRREGVEQVIVVDNGSTDLSLTGLRTTDPAAVVIETGANLGYGGGANLGARQDLADAAYLLVLNPDTEFGKGALDPLVAALDEEA